MQPGSGTVRVWRDLVAANKNDSTRSRIVKDNTPVLSVCPGTGGLRITSVAVKWSIEMPIRNKACSEFTRLVLQSGLSKTEAPVIS